MKRCLISLFLCLAFLLPLTTPAALTGEVIFRHPKKSELWISDVGDTRNARRMFKHTQDIYELAVQRDGPYILIAADPDNGFFAADAYLIDRNQVHAKAHNLTQDRFDFVWNIDISHAGDVVFTNTPTGREPAPPYGIYLIPRDALKNDLPKAELLFEREASNVTWAPDGVHIAYEVLGGGIYIYNVLTRGGSFGVSNHGRFPAFSSEGNRLAFVHTFLADATAINIISLEPRRRLKTIALGEHSAFIALKWAPDGQALVYTVYGPDNLYHNYVAPLDGGPHEEILNIKGDRGVPMFDWTKSAYAVEPTNRLTTRWAQLKQRNSK